MTTTYQLAQINVARMKGVNMDDPIMKEFVDNLDKVNSIAESSPGFVWRLKEDADSENPSLPYDEQVIINISVWESVQALEDFTYRTYHADIFRKRKKWFVSYGKMHYAMWWIISGKYPSVADCMSKLEYLQEHGPSLTSFGFKDKSYHVPPSGE